MLDTVRVRARRTRLGHRRRTPIALVAAAAAHGLVQEPKDAQQEKTDDHEEIQQGHHVGPPRDLLVAAPAVVGLGVLVVGRRWGVICPVAVAALARPVGARARRRRIRGPRNAMEAPVLAARGALPDAAVVGVAEGVGLVVGVVPDAHHALGQPLLVRVVLRPATHICLVSGT